MLIPACFHFPPTSVMSIFSFLFNWLALHELCCIQIHLWGSTSSLSVPYFISPACFLLVFSSGLDLIYSQLGSLSLSSFFPFFFLLFVCLETPFAFACLRFLLSSAGKQQQCPLMGALYLASASVDAK